MPDCFTDTPTCQLDKANPSEQSIRNELTSIAFADIQTLPRNHWLPLAVRGDASSFVSLCGSKRLRDTTEGDRLVLA
jgi:hypothetical protein